MQHHSTIVFHNNPEFRRLDPLWERVFDCYTGTPAVKRGPHADEYLPKTRAELEEIRRSADHRSAQYELRKSHAVYENIFRPTVDDVVGIMQMNPLHVHFGVEKDEESPEEVRQIAQYGNQYNDGLAGLKHRLNFAQALYGRYGLLLDIATDGKKSNFRIVEYPAERIMDGQCIAAMDGESALLWCLLDESQRRFNPLTKEWERKERLRVLGLDKNHEFYHAVLDSENGGNWIDFNLAEPTGQVVYPMFRQQRLNFVPFTVCNTGTLGMDHWEEPPYLAVADLAVALYQDDSLYKKALWNHATPTLVISNAEKKEEKKEKLSLGGCLWLNSDSAQATLLETSGSGLSEMRNCKKETRDALRYTSIRELLDGAGAGSSGEAIKLRTASGTANIAKMDRVSARALEEQLIFAAIWAGASPEEAAERISCQADTSYLSSDFDLSSVVSLMAANQSAEGGAGFLSSQNLYAVLERAVPGVLSSYEDNEVMKNEIL